MVAVPLMGCIMGCNSCWLYGRVNISRLNRKWGTGNGGNMEREENIRDNIIKPVSYTHLDVYKRQAYNFITDLNKNNSFDRTIRNSLWEIELF